MEMIRAHFLWHSEEGEKKFHLIKRDQICQSYENEDLGVRALKEMN